MTDKPIKQPGPDHPITIEPNPARIVVSIAGQVIADTQSALTLREADYPPVKDHVAFYPDRVDEIATGNHHERTSHA